MAAPAESANQSSGSSQAPPLEAGYTLDCNQYSFSPLLLFTEGQYFDKGHSNFNAVVTFFNPVLQNDMLANVLYERINMKYDDLLEHVLSNRMLVTCCIDSHFTAFQVLSQWLVG